MLGEPLHLLLVFIMSIKSVDFLDKHSPSMHVFQKMNSPADDEEARLMMPGDDEEKRREGEDGDEETTPLKPAQARNRRYRFLIAAFINTAATVGIVRPCPFSPIQLRSLEIQCPPLYTNVLPIRTQCSS